METRLDYYEWDNSTKFEKTPEGFLTGVANTTNIGVFQYRRKDGTIQRELRHPREVFNEDALQSMINRPVTMAHKVAKVDSKNFKQHTVGMTGSSVSRDELRVALPVTIMDADAVAEVEAGRNGLSWSYDCEMVPAEPGAMFLGMPYDYEQTNIRYNNLSVVDKGRAGDDAKIRMDSVDGVLVNTELDSKEGMRMPDDNLKVTHIDGVDYKAEAKVLEELHKVTQRADKADAELISSKEELSKITAERDSAKERCDSLSVELEALKKNHVDAEKVTEMVKARVELLTVAQSLKLDGASEMADEDIKKAVILQKFPGAKLDGKDSVYIQARFDAALELVGTEQKEVSENNQVLGSPKGDSKESKLDGLSPSEQAHLRYRERLQKRHLSVSKE